MLLSMPTVPVSSPMGRSQNPPMIAAKLIPKHFNVPFAIQHGYFRCVRYLLELESDPNERDNQLRTPLILCSYVENDRWSLSLAQNLLEKGAQIALEDHARRNALHHACALQRIHLVQLFLSCLDFDLQAKDCEGNTCLHYVAITGNCEIAELLMRTAEKINANLDQNINRDGCSAAVLALKYGHIECANQITHRDSDEFFVIPRPLSIYETSMTIDDDQANRKSAKKHRATSQPKKEISPSTLSFGLLKIIFNESDSGYSTRLAGFCKKETSNSNRRRKKTQAITSPRNTINSSKTMITEETHYSSTEALVNELQRANIEEQKLIEPDIDRLSVASGRMSPRYQLLMQQYPNEKPSHSTKDLTAGEEIKLVEPKIRDDDYQQEFETNRGTRPSRNDENHSMKRVKLKLQRPKTAAARPPTSTNAVGAPSRLSSAKTSPTHQSSHPKAKTTLHHRVQSATHLEKQLSYVPSEISNYSRTLYAGRPLSAAVAQHQSHTSTSQTDYSCSIREARGAASRYNNPEELFGLKPEQLFSKDEHVPKLMGSRSTNLNDSPRRFRRLKQSHIWQDDVDKLVDLYTIHHSSNYRPKATPPAIPVQPTSTGTPSEPPVETIQLSKSGRSSAGAKNLPSTQRSMKLSTLASLNIPRRSSVAQRSTIKSSHT